MCCSLSSARGDRLILKTGEVFFGEILRVDEDECSIKLLGGGVLSFRSAWIREHHIDYTAPEDQKIEWSFGDPFVDVSAGQRSDTRKTGFAREGFVLVEDETPVEVPRPRRRSSAKRTNKKLLSDVVRDVERGVHFAPPKSLLRSNGATFGDASLIDFYSDPATHANLSVTAYRSADPIRAIKRRAANSYAERVNKFRVVRDEAIEGVPYDAWLFEMKSEVSGEQLQQIQVFTSFDERVFVLTYVSPVNAFEQHRAAFEASIASISLTDPANAQRSSELENLVEDHEDELENEVLRRLLGSSDRDEDHASNTIKRDGASASGGSEGGGGSSEVLSPAEQLLRNLEASLDAER